jgi:hypothetical protein
VRIRRGLQLGSLPPSDLRRVSFITGLYIYSTFFGVLGILLELVAEAASGQNILSPWFPCIPDPVANSVALTRETLSLNIDEKDCSTLFSEDRSILNAAHPSPSSSPTLKMSLCGRQKVVQRKMVLL